MPDFVLPDLGEGLEEAEVISWHVAVGDAVTVDQIVLEVETAKAAVEVPIPFAGTVAALHAAPGTVVKVGEPLIGVESPAAGADPDAAPFREPGTITPDPDPDEASGNVLIGYGTTAAPATGRRRTLAERRAGASRSVGGADRSPAAARASIIPVISPLVRKMARDAGLDLRAIAATGPCGVVRRADVERAVRTPAPGTEHDATDTTNSETTAIRIPLRGLRRAVADKLTRSRREIPEATVWVDVDATALLAARTAMNATSPDRPASILSLVARFTVLALRRYPELNARIEGDEIVVPDHVHLGFAAQTDRGLVVPVIRDAHRMSIRDLSQALASRISAARSGELRPADLVGGTVTLNNYGVFGVDGSAAIINHPEVAIVGLGRIIDRPWVVDGDLCVRKVSQLTLTFDHRVCDGAAAGGFLRLLADYVEEPITALAEV